MLYSCNIMVRQSKKTILSFETFLCLMLLQNQCVLLYLQSLLSENPFLCSLSRDKIEIRRGSNRKQNYLLKQTGNGNIHVIFSLQCISMKIGRISICTVLFPAPWCSYRARLEGCHYWHTLLIIYHLWPQREREDSIT